MERKTGYPMRHDDDVFDLDSLLHPAQAFAHPYDVLNDADLTFNEKRAMLASWASDACAEEAMPTLRRRARAKRPVPFDEVMEALRALDKMARRAGRSTGSHRVLDRPRSSSGSPTRRWSMRRT